MDDKPEEIFELERALGIDSVDDYVWDGEKVTELKIWGRMLKDISPIAQLKSLEILDLSKNRITDISPLKNLDKLTTINLSDNKVSDLTSIMKLEKLTSLVLSTNEISDISPLTKLKSINSIVLNDNLITNILPFKKVLYLSELSLSGNRINDISPLKNLKKLRSLNLSFNQLSSLSPLKDLDYLSSLVASKNDISDLTPLKNLKKLTYLYLSDNKITDIHPLKELINLNWLNLSGNNISDISTLKYLESITTLSLSNNKISDIESLQELKLLFGLSLSNNSITNIFPLKFLINKGKHIKLKKSPFFSNSIHLDNNPIIIPPIPIIEKGNEAVLKYFEKYELERKKGTRAINEAKLIIIGEPESGKTTLMNYLQGKPFTVASTTQGFTIERWSIEDNQTNYRINIWDFGGQDIQSTVHQFFLTQDTLYVMVLNARKDELPDKYFEQIKSYAPDSPIIIVVNRIEENPSYEMGVKRLQETHKDKEGNSLIKGVFKVSLLKGHKELDPSYFPILEEMKQAIQKMLLEMPHIHRSVPITYLDVKEYLESAFFEDKPYISHDTYEQICREKGLNVESDDDLLGYLNNLGTVRYFDDLSLRNLQILNPEWLSDGVYRILVSERTKHLRGIITEKDFEPILQKTEEHQFVYPKKHYNYLIQMIRKFDIGYYDEDTNRIFIPRAFGLDYMQNFDNTLYKNEAIHFFFKYESFIPSIIMPAFITRMFGMVKDQLYSQNGVVLEQDGQFALVEQTTVKNRIDIWVSGDKSKGEYFEFFIEIRKVFREFHEKRPGLVVDEMIGLGKNSDVSVKYKQLIANKINGVNDYIGEDGIKYNIDELLGRFESKKDSNIAIATQNIFNNYGRDMYAGYIQIQYLASEIAEELDQIIANINDEHKKELEKLSDELKQLQSARSGSEANSILSQIKNTVKTLPKLISEEAVKWGTKEGLGGLNISDMLIGVQKNILHLLQNPNIGNFIDGNQNLM